MGRPRVPQEVRDLIRRLSAENRLWGTERIRGELRTLGIAVSKPHRTLRLRTPRPRGLTARGTIRVRPVLGGLHHVYERAA